MKKLSDIIAEYSNKFKQEFIEIVTAYVKKEAEEEDWEFDENNIDVDLNDNVSVTFIDTYGEAETWEICTISIENGVPTLFTGRNMGIDFSKLYIEEQARFIDELKSQFGK